MTEPLQSQATIVVVARNAEHTIGICMGSLNRQSHPPTKVILVDDGSTDATVEIAKNAYPGLDVISSPTRSISKNRNVGWQSAETEFVAFLDADCEAPPAWLENLLAAAAKLDVAAVGGGNKPPAGQSSHYDALAIMLASHLGSRGSLQGQVPSTEAVVPHIPTLNILYSKTTLEQVGGFDPRFARMGEDEDLSRRLRDMGHSLVAIPDAVVVHHQRADLHSWAKNMYAYGKGRTWLIRRHPNAWSPVFLIPPLAILLLPFYLICIAAVSLALCLKARRPSLWIRLTVLFSATHLPYGLGQIVGLIKRGDNREACRKRYRVGMVALKNAGNKGDEAILCAVSDRMEKLLSRPDCMIDPYLIAFGPSGLDVRPLPACKNARERVILDALAPARTSRSVRPLDLVSDAMRSLLVFSGFQGIFISGGQWLHDLSLPKHIVICSLFAFARVFRTRVGVFCIGVGPLRRGLSRWLTRRALGHGSLVVTRDDASTKLLRDCGLQHASTAADPALLLPTSSVATSKNRILISPCAWANFENIYALDQAKIDESFQNWTKLVTRLIADGYELAMLPTMNPEDRVFAEQIILRTGNSIECIETEHLSPSQVQGHIAASSALISMRLHPVIFASNCNTRFVALNYAAKVRAFCHQAGFDDQVVELDDPCWADEVLKKLGRSPEHVSDASSARTTQIDALNDGYHVLEQWLLRIESTRKPVQKEGATQCASLS
ncbi:glycosyltransferase [Roseovarius aestuarii]|uniref:Putative glycosyltransferase EpsH n=1 Tax=Roseovarius aestuarii TaxID=475083 RepID=A0A1X7BWD7_9RHOB|nr:glycosyltransferase [Roseovarius aestuarii]SMC13972.1 Putative glycosyltransferase EpsH [Roseovarius aestuarii]